MEPWGPTPARQSVSCISACAHLGVRAREMPPAIGTNMLTKGEKKKNRLEKAFLTLQQKSD